MNSLQDSIMDYLRPGWRDRAAAQDPIWSLLEKTAIVILTGCTWYFGNRWAWSLHLRLHPRDRLPFGNPASELPISAFTGSLLTGLLLLCVLGIAVNSLEGLIPWMRRRAETGSDRVPGLTIGEANKGLLKAAFALAFIAIPLDLYAIVTPWSAS